MTTHPFSTTWKIALLLMLAFFLSAHTAQAYFNVHVSGLGTGSGTITAPAGTGDGISCGTNCSEQYANNATVTVSQSAAAGSTFTGWGGDCSGTGVCSVTSTGTSKNITATFTAATCVPNPRADLRNSNGSALPVGTGNLPASISVKNFSTNCTYSLHMASYKVFDPWQAGSGTTFLATQRLHNDASVSIAPGETKSVSAGVPSCRYQTDLFEGPSAPVTNPDFAQMPAYTVFDWKFASSLPLCGPKLTVVKTVINNNGGIKTVADFLLRVGSTAVTSGVSTYFHAGTYTVSETNLPGYTAGSWGGDCSANGSVTLSGEENKTCTITNDDVATGQAPTVDLRIKQVGGGTYTNGPLPLPASGGNIDLQWTVAGDATSCTASVGWSGSKAFSNGQHEQTNIANGTTAKTYTIRCSNASGSNSDSVSVTIQGVDPVNGECKTPPNGGTYPTIPTGTLCDAGTASAIAGTGPWTWTCEGINGGTPASCGANKTGVLACSPERQQKGVLVPAPITAGGTTGVYTWNIVGSQTITCDAGVTPCSPAFPNTGEKTIRLTNGGASVSCYVDVKGSVKVTSNEPTTWHITRNGAGPLTQTTASRGVTYDNQRPSVYTISNVPVLNGFKPPVISPETKSLTIPDTGADIVFTIYYEPIGIPPGDDDDPPCTGDNCPPPDPNDPPVCSDEKDNDGDGFFDWDGAGVSLKDPGCTGPKDETEQHQDPECRDDIDNADIEDDKKDADDPGCWSLPDGTYNRDDNDERNAPPGAVTECNNGLDDDGDNKIDHVSVTPPDKKFDPGCASPTDSSELDDPIIEEI